jgi:hypothetical protein
MSTSKTLADALRNCQRVLDDKGNTTPEDWIAAEAAAREALARHDADTAATARYQSTENGARHYFVTKKLWLQFECYANSAADALAHCIDSDDQQFTVEDCDYAITDEAGNEVHADDEDDDA